MSSPDDWYYVLDGHEVKQATFPEWLEWITANKYGWKGPLTEAPFVVAKTTLSDAEVSTVFLALNHAFGEGPPILFETMVFGGALNDSQERYATWDEAVAGHARWVRAVQREDARMTTEPGLPHAVGTCAACDTERVLAQDVSELVSAARLYEQSQHWLNGERLRRALAKFEGLR